MLQVFHAGMFSSRSERRAFSKLEKLAAFAACILLGPLGIALICLAIVAMGLAILADRLVAMVKRSTSGA